MRASKNESDLDVDCYYVTLDKVFQVKGPRADHPEATNEAEAIENAARQIREWITQGLHGNPEDWLVQT